MHDTQVWLFSFFFVFIRLGHMKGSPRGMGCSLTHGGRVVRALSCSQRDLSIATRKWPTQHEPTATPVQGSTAQVTKYTRIECGTRQGRVQADARPSLTRNRGHRAIS